MRSIYSIKSHNYVPIQKEISRIKSILRTFKKKCISICAYTISYFNYLLLKNKSFSIIALSFVRGHAQTMWTISWTFLTTLPPWWTVLLNKLYW